MSSNAFAKIPRRVDGSGIVEPSRSVECSCTTRTGLIDTLGKAVSTGCSGAAFSDHLRDDSCGAWVLHLMGDVAIARPVAIVILHQARIADSIIRCWDPHTSARFLHDDGKNEAVVNLRFRCDFLNRVVNSTNFRSGIVGLVVLTAGGEHERLVFIEPV